MRYLTLIWLFSPVLLSGQATQFQSTRLPMDARNAALGGNVVSLADGDLMQYMRNPAVLDSVQIGTFGINYNPYFADIHAVTTAYQMNLGRFGPLAVGVVYLNYGEFEQRESNGQLIGVFQAEDYQMTIGKSHSIQSFTFGASLKYARNAIESYAASALLFDIGGIYRHPNRDLTFALVFSNFGFILQDYLDGSRSEVPFDVQIGTSFKPRYMPFRFSITAYNLVTENLIFDEEELGNRIDGQIDRILRRVSIGTELILSQNFQLLFGYNHLRRQELSLTDSAEGAGLSFGLLIGIKRFKFRYSRTQYHAGAGGNFFSIQTNFQSFKKS